MQIHDELSWEKHKDDPLEVFMKFQEIMQDWDQTYVPIVADMDATKTTWADKKGIDNFEELQDYFKTKSIADINCEPPQSSYTLCSSQPSS